MGELGLLRDEFDRMTIGDFNRACIGYQRREERRWLHTRELIALQININRKKGAAAIKGEKIYPTSFDHKEVIVSNSEEGLEFLQTAIKAWKLDG